MGMKVAVRIMQSVGRTLVLIAPTFGAGILSPVARGDVPFQIVLPVGDKVNHQVVLDNWDHFNFRWDAKVTDRPAGSAAKRRLGAAGGYHGVLRSVREALERVMMVDLSLIDGV